uniref:Uncharacterized protein n=1 Tax=Panagrolaimus sp. ES5 TaxID=591445 RepID=A0AC34GH05_9BILA
LLIIMSYYYNGYVLQYQQPMPPPPYYNYQQQPPPPPQMFYQSIQTQYQVPTQEYDNSQQSRRQRNARRRKEKFQNSAPYSQHSQEYSYTYSHQQSIAPASISYDNQQPPLQKPLPLNEPSKDAALSRDDENIVSLCISNECHDRIFQRAGKDNWFINKEEFMKLCNAIFKKKDETTQISSTEPAAP